MNIYMIIDGKDEMHLAVARYLATAAVTIDKSAATCSWSHSQTGAWAGNQYAHNSVEECKKFTSSQHLAIFAGQPGICCSNSYQAAPPHLRY